MKTTIAQAVFDSVAARKVIAAGHAKACRELEAMPTHKLGTGNPNHPDYAPRLFGYLVPEFMAKQYGDSDV